MSRFISNKYYVYDSYENLKNNINGTKFNIKNIVKYNPKLNLLYDNKVIRQITDIQSLYLYPLTLMDYSININKLISINIMNIDAKLDYIEILSSNIFEDLKAVEILIKETYDKNQYIRINDIINYLINKKIKVSLNIKKLTMFNYKLLDNYKKCDYFKIFLSDVNNEMEYTKFKETLKNMSVNKNALIHVKSYVNINESCKYESVINDLSDLNVDIFQLSKELIPLNMKNEDVEIDIQNNIRNLEKKYNGKNGIKFISVKDLTCLYYPRFELDNRNSRTCYACRMKPYIKNNLIIPCKVNKIFDNLEDFSTNIENYHEKYESIKSRCGIECDDCASIFENDILTEIEKEIINNNINEFIIEIED